MYSLSTSTKTKRLLHFSGHPSQNNSQLITRICKDYETISSICSGECATRTMLNLFNLYAVRGCVSKHNELLINTSMSGPHHYFGSIEPNRTYIIKILNSLPHYIEIANADIHLPIKRINEKYITHINKYNWISGKSTNTKLHKYNLAKDNCSLFKNQGVLELDTSTINIKIIKNGYEYDLSSYKVQLVNNLKPFRFTSNMNKHAQHKLRVVTYYYGSDYVKNYIMKRCGIFVEKHEFIQSITPLNNKCSGYVIIGREINNKLELIGLTIPFGYTILVEEGAIHGDSTLVGLYSMAMTGNHSAMKTANTVFLKDTHTNNVAINTSYNPKQYTIDNEELLITSDKMNSKTLTHIETKIKGDIIDSLAPIEKLYYNPDIQSTVFGVQLHKLYTV